jgi:hypothetical protein
MAKWIITIVTASYFNLLLSVDQASYMKKIAPMLKLANFDFKMLEWMAQFLLTHPLPLLYCAFAFYKMFMLLFRGDGPVHLHSTTIFTTFHLAWHL